MSKIRKTSDKKIEVSSRGVTDVPLIFQPLAEVSAGEWTDLGKVFKEINAFEQAVGEKAMDMQLKSRIEGKFMVLANMKNSDFYTRRVRVSKAPAVRELISCKTAKKNGTYKLNEPLLFEDLNQLSQLWELYAEGFIRIVDGSTTTESDSHPSPVEAKYTMICRKLELVGATLTVADSRNTEIIGTTGRVLSDHQNVVKLIDHRNKIRTIPKEVCTFSIHVGKERTLTVRGIDLIRHRE